jgi:ribosomal protein S25
MTVTNMCPECKQGKHYNCTITVLDSNDTWKKCPCLSNGHRTQVSTAAPVMPYDGGTSSGHSGTDTSQARSEREDSDGTTAHAQEAALHEAKRIRGITVKELRSWYKLHHGQASSALSTLHKKGLLARLSQVRDGCKVYVVPEFVAGRETEPHGRQRPAEPKGQEYTLTEIKNGTGFASDARFIQVH